METHVFLGIKCVCERLGQYGLLCAIFAISTFLLIVPFNLLNTVQSNRFIQYMGVVESHIRIDLRQGHDIENRFERPNYMYIDGGRNTVRYFSLGSYNLKKHFNIQCEVFTQGKQYAYL